MTFFLGVLCGVLLFLTIVSILSIKRKCSYRLMCGGVNDAELCIDCKGEERCIIAKQRNDLLAMTRVFNKHPKGYKGICQCKECLSKKME